MEYMDKHIFSFGTYSSLHKHEHNDRVTASTQKGHPRCPEQDSTEKYALTYTVTNLTLSLESTKVNMGK